MSYFIGLTALDGMSYIIVAALRDAAGLERLAEGVDVPGHLLHLLFGNIYL